MSPPITQILRDTPLPFTQQRSSLLNRPSCGPMGQRFAQVALTPAGSPLGERALFVNPSQMQALAALTEVPPSDRPLTLLDDQTLGRLLAAMPILNSPFYADVVLENNQTASRAFELCRDDDGVALGQGGQPSRYPVYIALSGLPYLNNICQPPNVRRLIGGMHFDPAELRALILDSGYLNDPTYYCTSNSDASLLSLAPDILLSGDLQNWVQGSSAFSTDRRQAIITAFNHAVALERLQRDATQEQRNAVRVQLEAMPRQMEAMEKSVRYGLYAVYAAIVATLASVYMIANQRGWTKPIDRVLDTVFTRLWNAVGLGTKVDFVTELTRPMVESGRIRQAVGREADYGAMREHFHRRIARILVVTARAGEGKTHFIDGLAHEIFGGRIPEANASNARIFRLSLGELVGHSDVKYVGQMQTRWNDFTRQVDQALNRGQEVYITIDEIHRLNGLGATSGGGSNDLGNTVKDWISKMERNPSIRMFGATTVAEYPQLVALKSSESHASVVDEALVRRFPQLRLGTLDRAGLRDILVNVAREWQNEPIRGAGKSSRHLVIPDSVIDRALELGSHPSVKIANPDAALTILDMAQARTARTTVDGQGDGRVTLDVLHERFAEEYHLVPHEVRAWRPGEPLPQTSPPPPALRPTLRPPAPPTIGRNVFEAMLRQRYSFLHDSHNAADLQLTTTLCENLWRSHPRWTETGGVRLPSWEFIEAAAGAHVQTSAPGLRAAFDRDTRTSRPEFDRLPDEVREIGRRAFEFRPVP